ncbi:MAG: enoyl-CoA hydratase-related protein [Burkholderiaceae bacterium]
MDERTEAGAAIRVEVDYSGLATLTLSQPERGNPIDGDFCREFKQAFLRLWDTEGLRAVLLRAEGKNFSLGGDVKQFYGQRENLAPLVRQWTSDLHMGLSRAWTLPVPIIAQVHGYAMGGSCALVAGCDVVVAARSAKFGSAFSQLGFSCDSGSSPTLTFRMGPARARRFVLLAEMLSADEALSAGLADRVADDDALESTALALARQLGAGPTVAYGEVKRLFAQAGMMQLQAQLEDEAMTLARVSASHDAREGVAAFVERRKPKFTGR